MAIAPQLRDHPNGLRVLSVIIAIAAIFLWLVWQLFAGRWALDLSAVYFAALSFGNGDYDQIYQARPFFFGETASDNWDAIATQLGYPGERAAPFIYAPIWAAIFAPIAVRTDPIAFYNGVLVFHACLCLVSVWLAYRIVRPRRISLIGWWLSSFAIILLTSPFALAFFLNQPQITVTFLILLSFERYRSGALIAAGIALGLAASIKIMPAALAVIFLMDRRWTAAAVAMATGCAVLVASVAIAGVDLHRGFIEQLRHASSFVLVVPINFSVQGLLSGFSNLHGENVMAVDGDTKLDIYQALPWVGFMCKLALSGTIGVLWWKTRGAVAEMAVLGRLMALWCAIILFGPIAWSHYLIGPLLLLPGLLDRLPKSVALPVVGSVVALVFIGLRPMLSAFGADPYLNMVFGVSALVVMIWAGMHSATVARAGAFDTGQTS